MARIQSLEKVTYHVHFFRQSQDTRIILSVVVPH